MGSCSISCLLLLLSCFIVSSTTTSDSAINSNSDKVTLELYYESLCPYSANFIVNYLEKIFLDEQLISIVDLKLVPYGNARIGPNNTITCQHGQFECLLNTVEACAIKIWPDLEKHFPFIYCVETLVHERKYPEWESCYGKLNLDPKPISDCYSSGFGKELELQYAAETDDLQPPHKYAPWVVVDGQPLYEDYEDVVSYVCKAYKAASVPQACSIIYLNTVLSGKDKPARSVCDKETIMPTLLDRVRIAITSWMHQAYLAAAV